ncbi:MAG: hypothetical protein K0S56_920 [Microvirga sp.]|jgi:hypothetical protein|nr:hypothetical protein [Microvirga sp.]
MARKLTTAYCGPRSFPEENRIIGDFVSTILWGEPGRIQDYCTTAIFDGDKLIAGVVYYNYHPAYGTIELATAGIKSGWMSRRVLHAVFAMPFQMLGCQTCVMRVGAKYSPALKGARSLGGTETVLPRMRGRDEDEHVFTFSDDQWMASKFYRPTLQS